jgi:ABC-type amino acid transport substrate-binding protein
MKAQTVRTFLAVAVTLTVALSGMGCGKDGKQNADGAGKPAAGSKWASGTYDRAEFADRTLAILSGSTFVAVSKEKVGARQYKYYDSRGLCVEAILAGEADGTLVEEPVARKAVAQHPDSLIVLYPPVDVEHYAYLFRKQDGGKLRAQFNAFLDTVRANGVYKDMVLRWVDTPDSPPMPEITLASAEKTLIFATSDSSPPFSFKNESGEWVGFDIEMALRFARANGYGLEIKAMEFVDIIPSISAGSIDFAANLIATIEERKAFGDFAEPVYLGGTVMLARK